MAHHASRRARRVELPDAARTADPAPDYATAFAAVVGDAAERSPEQWARLILEGAPTALKWCVVTGWRFVLRLRLAAPHTPGHVLGWRIVGTTAEAITLESPSTLITAHKIVQVRRSAVTVTTLIRYERRSGRLIWAAVRPIHHLTEPWLVGRAAAP